VKEKRSEPRFMCADLIKVRIQDAAGAREVIANLEDISPSGACIQLEAATLEGADVEMMCAKSVTAGLPKSDTTSASRSISGALGIGVDLSRSTCWKFRLTTVPAPIEPDRRTSHPSRVGINRFYSHCDSEREP
jgi:hypothetical protein